MASASGAQREPSMEEILASIRRIIEDSDGGRVATAEPPPAENDAGHSASVIEVDAFRAELRGRNAAPTRDKPMTMAEVQAMIGSDDAEPTAPPVSLAVTNTPPTPVAPVQPTVSSWTAPLPVAAHDPVESEGGSAAAFAKVQQTGSSNGFGETANDPTIPAGGVDPGDHLDAAAAALERALEYDIAEHGNGGESTALANGPVARPALISESAGRQVAAAFGELSEAFATRSRKTFDDLAEDMMRPMLQEWLDNNLPTLVERLVREEIERVARGAQK